MLENDGWSESKIICHYFMNVSTWIYFYLICLHSDSEYDDVMVIVDHYPGVNNILL